MTKTYPKILWKDQTSNRKTGNIPTAFIGATVDESRESCSGCPLLDKTCYAQNGAVRMSLNSLSKRLKKVGEALYSFEEALRMRWIGAKYVRVSAIGDAARANPEELRSMHDKARASGLGWLAYTHFQEDAIAAGNQDLFCASTSTFTEADEAIEKGFKRATVVVPMEVFDDNVKTWMTPGGNKAFICPAIVAHSKGRRVTCNQCGMCDPSRPGPKVVMFPEHGKSVQGRLNAHAKAGKTWAINLKVKL
jgi:hypothetical protein